MNKQAQMGPGSSSKRKPDLHHSRGTQNQDGHMDFPH